MKKILLFLLLLQMSIFACFADEYKDPASNVIYTYDPAGDRAEVKAGWEHDEDYYGNQYEPGSPDAMNEIVILDRITIDGKEYIVDKISYCAFSYMENVTSVVIPSSVKSIEYGAFLSCKSLSTVVLSQGLNSIGYVAFAGCSSLKQLSLPEGLKRIGGGALSFCGMSDITIPSSVESIADMQAFYSPALKTITSLIKDPFEVYENFNPKLRDVTLRVPVGTKSQYEATTGWRIIKNIEEIDINEITFTKDQMATIILPTEPDAGKGKYYRLDRVDGTEIVFEQEQQPRAHVPYIIVPFEDFCIDPGQLELEGMKPDTVSVDGISFIGTFRREEIDSKDGLHVEIIDATSDCSALPAEGQGVKIHVGTLRAYLTWHDPYNPGGSKGPQEEMKIVLHDHGTGSLSPAPSPEGEGRKNAAIYDLSGKKVNGKWLNGKHPKGIYIKDRKKWVTK